MSDPSTFTTTVQNVVPKLAFTGRRPPLHLDPPEHTPYRTALNPYFTAEKMRRIEPRLHFTGYRRSRSLPGIETGLETGSLDAACALIPSPRRHAIAVPAGKPVYVTRHALVARASDPAVHDLLTTSRRAFVWGYGHYFVFAAAAAVGGGLGVAVDQAGGPPARGPDRGGRAVGVPVALYKGWLWCVPDRRA